MASVLEVAQKVATYIGIDVPTAVYGGTDRAQVELAEYMNEAARHIAFDRADWQVLRSIASITGDGVTTAFNLPDDYSRMVKKGSIRLSANGRPLSHVLDSDEWLAMTSNMATGIAPGYWTLMGGQILIEPVVATGVVARYTYIKKYYTGVKEAFDNDADVFSVDPEGRLLKLCTIYMWKKQKGFPYAQEMDDFEAALEKRVGADRGPKILVDQSRWNWWRDNPTPYQGTYPYELG